MIKGITPMGRSIQVSGGQPSSTYINGYSGLQGVGNMRFNTSNQNMEVFDGNNWIQLNMTYAGIGLTDETEQLLDWAREKRDQELRIEKLLEEYPNLKDLKEKYEILLALLQKDAE